MAEKHKQPSPTPAEQSVEVELDTLNAELQSRHNAPTHRRRRMEATIEADSRNRRRGEAPVSSSVKKS